MKIVKKINNNIAVGIDSMGNEVIVFGKGIGFEKTPYEITDISKIDRTFYGINEQYYSLINQVDSKLLESIAQMVDIIQSKFDTIFNPNLTFMIADHLSFSIQRYRSNQRLNFPYSYEIEEQYPEFNKAATWIIVNINKRFDVHLEKGEISCVAMHMINAQKGTNDKEETIAQKSTRILKQLIRIIEDYFELPIDSTGMNYYRFRHHIQYFVKRKEGNEEFQDDNVKVFEDMIRRYPETHKCVLEMDRYLEDEYGEPCSKDELLYLMIHVNRLCLKEKL